MSDREAKRAGLLEETLRALLAIAEDDECDPSCCQHEDNGSEYYLPTEKRHDRDHSDLCPVYRAWYIRATLRRAQDSDERVILDDQGREIQVVPASGVSYVDPYGNQCLWIGPGERVNDKRVVEVVAYGDHRFEAGRRAGRSELARELAVIRAGEKEPA